MPVELIEARPGLPELILVHRDSRVRLSLQGAHVTEYLANGENLLWLSRSARFSPGVPVRGGIPVCWPWFGASPDDASWPQHGFARTSRFRLGSRESDTQHTAVTLVLDEAPAIPRWRGAASMEIEIRLGDHLWIELRTRNLTDRDLLVGAGLHSYFSVSDVRSVSIPALTDLEYLDKPSGFARKTQATPLRIHGEIDRVYLQPPRTIALFDPHRRGSVVIEAWGHEDIVVWNPGPAIAKSMADFDDEGYRNMVCIEPALALGNRRCLAPGAGLAMGQTIQWVQHPSQP